MKKKSVIRKLNRTQLKKEGSNEIYLTSKDFVPLFGFDDKKQLQRSRNDEKAKYKFRIKDSDEADDLVLTLTNENNEARITGITSFIIDNDIQEIDDLILECIETPASTEYWIGFFQRLNSRVLQLCERGDESSDYIMKKKENNQITFQERDDLEEYSEKNYWLWDDHFNENRWNDIVGKEIEAVFICDNQILKKRIRIIDSKKNIKKLIKAQSRSKLVETEKKLYRIEELKDGNWVEADFLFKEKEAKAIEILDDGWRLRISKRQENNSIYSEGDII